MALHETSVMDPRAGQVVNHDLAEYHITTNAEPPSGGLARCGVKSAHGLASAGRAEGRQERRRAMTAQEIGTVTGTKDKDYNLIWYVEACPARGRRCPTLFRT
jgi:hypothetical protein